MANAKKANATIVTTGGAPVEIATANGKARSIVLRDPDGFFLQLVEEAPAANAPARERPSRLAGVHHGKRRCDGVVLHRHAGDRAHRLVGFLEGPCVLKFVGAPAGPNSAGLSGLIPRPGSSPAYVEFTEFRGVPRTKFHLRVRDPGAPAMAVQVSNLPGMVALMKAAGASVLSTNGEIVDFGGGTHTIFIEDPNGMNVEVFERTGAPQGKGKGKAKTN